MNTPTPTRAAALVMSILMTFVSVQLIATYALPEPPAPALAQAPAHG